MTMISQMGFEIAGRSAAWPILPILMADLATGEIVYCAESAAQIFGYRAMELVGLPVEELIHESARADHVGWRREFVASKVGLEAIGRGRLINGRRKDGANVPVHVSLTSINAMDRVVGVALVIDLSSVLQQFDSRIEAAVDRVLSRRQSQAIRDTVAVTATVPIETVPGGV